MGRMVLERQDERSNPLISSWLQVAVPPDRSSAASPSQHRHSTAAFCLVWALSFARKPLSLEHLSSSPSV